MKSAYVHKARPIVKSEPVDSVSIVIDGTLPDFDNLSKAAEFYDNDAQDIADALCASLPQGVLDRVIGHLLERKATTLLAVPLFSAK